MLLSYRDPPKIDLHASTLSFRYFTIEWNCQQKENYFKVIEMHLSMLEKICIQLNSFPLQKHLSHYKIRNHNSTTQLYYTFCLSFCHVIYA